MLRGVSKGGRMPTRSVAMALSGYEQKALDEIETYFREPEDSLLPPAAPDRPTRSDHSAS